MGRNSPSNTEPFGGSTANPASWMSGTVALYLNSFLQVDYSDSRSRRYTTPVPTCRSIRIPIRSHSVTGRLCEPIDATEGDSLGLDKVAFFADPRWQRLWFYCDGG